MGIVERGVIAGGVRLASAMNDAPRSFYSRAPLIVLPGIGFVWRDYLALLTHYAGERRVFSLDWPGFGGSAKPSDGEYTVTDEQLTQTVSTWIDSLGIGRAVLLATGISGVTAVRYACAHPQRILGVALTSPIGLCSSATSSSFTSRLLRSPWLMQLVNGYVVSLLVGPASTAEARQVLERHQQFRRATDHKQAVRAYAPLWSMAQQSPMEISRLAKSISAPGIVMHGALDPLVTEADASQAAATLGVHGSLAVTLPEAGHLPFLQQPARFYQALSGLLETAEMMALQSP